MLVDRRIGLLFAVFLLALGAASARALWFGTVKGGTLAQAANIQQVSTDTVPALRGTITDRHGTELAVSEPASDVSATPYLVKQPAKVARQLSPLVDKPAAELEDLLSRRDTGFQYLAREVPAAQVRRIRKLRLEGITLTPSERRDYPRGMLAAQVLGTVGTDGDGLSGLEYRLDHALEGTPGTRRSTLDALGETLRVKDLKPVQDGAPVKTTLDAAIQEEAEEVLQGVGRTYSPKAATAVVMDPQTSEVLAIANWPRIDANQPGAAPAYAQQDRAVGYTYEPGSTFKPFTIAGALQDGTVTPDEQWDLPPQIQVADRTIHDAEDRGPVTLSTAGILAQSSNVGTVMIGQKVGAKRFDSWIRRFGFGTPTGVDLPGEERGLVLKPSQYSGSSMGNLPIGQGVSVTPMQLAAAYSAIANGGVLRTPKVIESIGGNPVREPAGKRVISSSVAAQVRKMLEGVVAPGGTASQVAIPGYAIGGKTGTANKVDPDGGYSKTNYVASFVGMAPIDHPKLLISIMVDSPRGGSYFGAQVAAPAFGKIAAFALPYLRIAPK